MKDGWHIVKGFMVYVENNKVVRGMKKDHNGSWIPASIYKWDEKLKCYNSHARVNVYTFRNGKYEIM